MTWINNLYLKDYIKWRTTYLGGRDFVDYYLLKYSDRESDTLFNQRKSITPCPNYVKKEVNETINTIVKQLVYVSREGGDPTYVEAIESNINLKYDSMISFTGNYVLPELLPMSQVLVYVDMPPLSSRTRYNNKIRPYVYTYCIEQLGEIVYGPNHDIVYLELNLDDKKKVFELEDNRVKVTLGTEVGYLDIPKIPAHLVDIKTSIIDDACEYQMALMNLESSDFGHCLLANFPFYVEQFDPKSNSQYSKPVATPSGRETKRTAEIGVSDGRRYPHPTEKPGFIAPPTEPLKTSMLKQEQIIQRIKELINGKVEEVGNGQGLLYISSVLQIMEIKIAEYFHYYLGKTNTAKIIYPQYFDTLTFEEKKDKISQLEEKIFTVPSKTYSREAAKEISRLLLGHCVSSNTMEKIEKEVDTADYLTADPEIIASDVENGLVSHATASIARGYPEDEVDIANEEHAKRLAEIAKSQTLGLGANAARGIKDAEGVSGTEERKAALQTDKDPVVTDKTRGKGK